MTEYWTHATASPRAIIKQAAAIEQAGWDGLCVVDSQNLSGDPYVALAMAATSTERIGLGTGVTNSVTRVAAATAASIASVDRLSHGRAVLGIGRGDSALAHIGLAPARLAQFEAYSRHLQTYLAGEAVPFSELGVPDDIAQPIDALKLADASDASRIGWIAGGRKVPLEVAASGPKVIKMAAIHADRIMFTIGADVERLTWGIDLAKEARRGACLDPDGISFGAYINCVCHQDKSVAQQLVRGGLTTLARFSVMHGKTHGPTSKETAETMVRLRNMYDMRKHTQSGSTQAEGLPVEFIEKYAIAGPPDYCIPRLQDLSALGLDKLFFGVTFRLGETAEGQAAQALVEKEVLPALRV